MTSKILLLPIIIPLLSAALTFVFVSKFRALKGFIALFASLLNLLLAIKLFGHELYYSAQWLGNGLEFSLRLYHFSAFIILAAAFFSFLTILYSIVFLRDKTYAGQFYAYLLLSLSFVNGAVLADNLLVMLLFWEASLITLFAMIAIGGKQAFKTATKAFIIVGICDLCMMLGIVITGWLAGTLVMSKISLSLTSLGSVAFLLLMIGAISKAGSMPFHSWIPDAAVDAPLPFMAFMPAALEKLLGIYLLTRISMDLFKLCIGSWISILLMTVGAITIIFAVMMALIQKDYKRLLSYHAISQVGYMILGIGTALPAGIIGGLFHMINNALYKSGLFFTAGSVEKQSGTTNLEKLGGLGRNMPVTFICFIVTAVSISGVPPFNGFFSKELIYDAALKSGMIFYIAAVAGSFFTAASFLKLGHSVYLGKVSQENKNIKEAPLSMLVPMIIIASICVLFGVYNYLPLTKFIQPILVGANGHNFYGMPENLMLIAITLAVLIAAVFNHIIGVRLNGSAVKAADHIHYAPVLSWIYKKAQDKFFDPYIIGLKLTDIISKAGFLLDRGIDWLYENLIVMPTYEFTRKVRRLYSGNYSKYLGWLLAGTVLVVIFLTYSA